MRGAECHPLVQEPHHTGLEKGGDKPAKEQRRGHRRRSHSSVNPSASHKPCRHAVSAKGERSERILPPSDTMNETPVRATGVHGGAESRASNWPISACARPPAPPRFPPAARKSRNERSQAASPSAHAPHWRRRGAPFRGAQGADLKGWLGDEAEPHLSAPTCFPCRIEASLCLISPPPLRPYEARGKESNRNRSAANGRK